MSSKFKLYDARGNKYFVATPDQIREFKADFPETAGEAAKRFANKKSVEWAMSIVNHVCGNHNAIPITNSCGKRIRSDGLLLGPFPVEGGHGLLIVNTNGTLAEISGNGSTIFSQFLVDNGDTDGSANFYLHVFSNPSKPIKVPIEPAELKGKKGFWIDMGTPTYKPKEVGASSEYFGISSLNGREVSRVFALEDIDSAWSRSQFVRVGNPHCVTFLESKGSLSFADTDSRYFDEKGESDLYKGLRDIANQKNIGDVRGTGRPCEDGINLQWAVAKERDRVHARVFERGEGWTKSSGSSATAVACAARHLGLVKEAIVVVEMAGGELPVRFDERDGRLERVLYFGEAQEWCNA